MDRGAAGALDQGPGSRGFLSNGGADCGCPGPDSLPPCPPSRKGPDCGFVVRAKARIVGVPIRASVSRSARRDHFTAWPAQKTALLLRK